MDFENEFRLTKAKQMTDTSLKNELKEKTSALTVAKQVQEKTAHLSCFILFLFYSRLDCHKSA